MPAKDVVKRYAKNPILTPKDVPYPCKQVYNSSAVKTDDGYVMVLRIDQRRPEPYLFLGLARSKDGLKWTVDPNPLMLPEGPEENAVYDPRVTRVGDDYVICYATDTAVGIRMGIATTRDFKKVERKFLSEPDNRNAVVFPEKINGLYCRLDRPFARIYEKERPYDVWISYSPDLVFWGKHDIVLRWQDVSWGSHKIGPAAPPIRTKQGWLTLFHGAELREPGPEGWGKTYRAGVMLLDLKDPSKIVGRCAEPILEPEPDVAYENEGYRPKVIFPCGLIDMGDGTCRIYYGASDQVMALATAKIADLIALCK
jgi:beta-1,4-mannooligosaccharide/beta-1,4-mannosyl-N-acetylglucosamine phosphorylase